MHRKVADNQQSFSKDQVSYYIHNYDIPNHKHGRFTLVERKAFDRIIKEHMETNSLAKEKERREQQPKTVVVPEGYISVAQIAEKYGVSQKHVTAKTREGKVPKLVIKHFNYYNEEAPFSTYPRFMVKKISNQKNQRSLTSDL